MFSSSSASSFHFPARQYQPQSLTTNHLPHHIFNMRFFAIAALLSVSVYALPQGADGSVIARSAEPEAIAEALAEAAELYARADKTLKVGAKPDKALRCPQTPNYEAHTYTKGQLTAAFLAGAKLNAKGKQVGASK